MKRTRNGHGTGAKRAVRDPLLRAGLPCNQMPRAGRMRAAGGQRPLHLVGKVFLVQLEEAYGDVYMSGFSMGFLTVR